MSIFGMFREHIKTLSEKKNSQIVSDDDAGVRIKLRAKRNSKNLPSAYDDLSVSRKKVKSWKDKTKNREQYKAK